MNEEKDRESEGPPLHLKSNSFLVRVWQEAGQGADLRFYLRDLRSGEERYLGDQSKICEVLTRGLRPKDAAASRNEKTA